MNPPSIVFAGGGVHGNVCWLIAYSIILVHVALRRTTAQYRLQISDDNTCIHSYTDRVTNITVEYDDI